MRTFVSAIMLFALLHTGNAQSVSEKTGMDNEDVILTFHITNNELSLYMDNTVPVRALQLDVNNVESFPAGLTIDTPLGPANYEYQSTKSKVRFVIYEFSDAVIAPGNDVRVFRVYTTFDNYDELTISDIVIADANNTELTNVKKVIDYSASSLPAVPVVTASCSLGQNYPNPFNPSTTIPYTVSNAGTVRIAVYAMDGTLVTLLQDGYLPAGEYTAIWTGANEYGNAMPSGTYFYTIETQDVSITRSMLLTQ